MDGNTAFTEIEITCRKSLRVTRTDVRDDLEKTADIRVIMINQ